MAKLTMVAYVNFMGGLFVTPDMKLHIIGWRIIRWVTYSYCVFYLILVWIDVPMEILRQIKFCLRHFLAQPGFFPYPESI